MLMRQYLDGLKSKGVDAPDLDSAFDMMLPCVAVMLAARLISAASYITDSLERGEDPPSDDWHLPTVIRSATLYDRLMSGAV